VSVTTSPVTHTAEAAVKVATCSGAPPGPALATGSSRRAVPTRMPAAKAAATFWAGWRSR
jgi:hypothetical protein